MKKVALIIALFTLLATVAGAGISNDDKDFHAGLKSYNSKNYASAVRHFKDYISRKPDPTAYYLAGYSLYKLGKFSEADDYFRDAYLIDPEFSLEKVGLIKKSSGEVVVKDAASVRKADSADGNKETSPGAAKAVKPQIKEAATKRPDQSAPAVQKATEPAKAPLPMPAPKPAPAAQPAPQTATAPAFPAVPVMPAPRTQIPNAAGPAALIGVIAAMGMIIVVIALAVYIYYCLCMFLIAKKLNVPNPWTAWIPLVQIWTFVVSAGKPGWWILFLLIPLVNAFVAIYLWMCITENLGKNKWLGLLILVPLVGFVYPGWLAFSKSESTGHYSRPDEPMTE